jgi:hypothetical protein
VEAVIDTGFTAAPIEAKHFHGRPPGRVFMPMRVQYSASHE